MEKKKPSKTIFLKEQRVTVSIGASTAFGKEKISLSLTENVREGVDPMDLIDEIYEVLEEKLDEQFELLCSSEE